MNQKNQIEIAKKKLSIIDQTASMHFKLSDTYKKRACIGDGVEILISVILCGITFLDYEKFISVDINKIHLAIGFVSVFLFAFTLLKQMLGYKELSEKHFIAGKIYVKIKRELKNKINQWECGLEEDVLVVLDEKMKTLDELPQIPEKHFAKLKHSHKTKVAFSKFLDEHPNDFWLVCKIKFRLGCK